MAPQQNAATVTMPAETAVQVERTFDAPRQLVWDAWTSCDHLPNWLLGPPGWSMNICEVDLREGGDQRLAWRGPEGEELEIRSTFIEINPPRQLSTRESWGGDWPESINTITFIENGNRTTITITIQYPSQQARDAALETGMTDGMAGSFENLAAYLATLQ